MGKRKTTHMLKEYPVRKGDVEFFGNGTYYFSTLFKDVSNAESYVHLSFYRFKHDSVGKEFLQLLKTKAKGNVKVRLLLDFVGSVSFPKKEVRELKKHGVELVYSHRPSFPFFFTSLNRRNHHKIIVIDGKIGFVGGFNVGDNYAEKNPNIGFWRDYMVRVKGSGVEDLQDQFLSHWYKSGRDGVTKETILPDLSEGKSSFQLFASNGGFFDSKVINLIKSAKNRILIGSPYFIPTRKVKIALLEAAKRGVEIKVIIPEKADQPLVKERAFSEFSHLMEKGIQLFLYKNGFYHAKIMMVDQNAAYVGTSNFDIRSFRTNDELVLFTGDKNFLGTIEENLQEDLHHSEKQSLSDIKAKNVLSKTKRAAAHLFTNFL